MSEDEFNAIMSVYEAQKISEENNFVRLIALIARKRFIAKAAKKLEKYQTVGYVMVLFIANMNSNSF